jgi:hypothetical protein
MPGMQAMPGAPGGMSVAPGAGAATPARPPPPAAEQK